VDVRICSLESVVMSGGVSVARSTDCLFCRVAAGEIPVTVVRSDASTVAFRDVNPQAPTHILVIPVRHYRDVTELARDAPETMAELMRAAGEIAAAEGLGEAYRLVFNTGVAAGQSVFHVHAHLLGGRELSWPPG
jgi:histidine triad (HIT) family protein